VKRFLYVSLAVSLLLIVPSARAQGLGESEHVNVGVLGNFIRLSDGSLNMAGIGARFSVNIAPVVQLEAESAYDFEQGFSRGFTDSTTGTVSIERTNLRVLDGLFGPKLQTNKGPVRLFATAKGGFMNFNVSHAPATFSTVGNAFENLRGSNIYGVFYPGAGLEAFWGPIGLRLDVGDEMFFRNGAHNNLRVSFGPTIRF
jgi:hypothetical protein